MVVLRQRPASASKLPNAFLSAFRTVCGLTWNETFDCFMFLCHLKIKEKEEEFGGSFAANAQKQ